VSATNVQSASSITNRHLDVGQYEPSRFSVADPSIDDPVNNTGLGPRRGDLQLSNEFAYLVRLICEANGELS